MLQAGSSRIGGCHGARGEILDAIVSGGGPARHATGRELRVSGWPPSIAIADPRVAGALIGLLGLLFLGRVVGQLVVAMRAPSWLPPMTEWYSGLLPYRPLLATQAVVVVVLGVASGGLLLQLPVATARRPDIGGILLWLGWLYLLSMIGRYGVRMARHPEARWFGRTIPIVFHMVLASAVLVLGSYLRG